jgi:uncharacterized protein (TIGR03546 family)
MVFYVIRLCRKSLQALTTEGSPRHLALGFALGMVIGLVPKGNLIAGTLAILLLSLHTNLVSAAVATGLFTLVGSWLDPVAHRIGWLVLTKESWQPYWARFFEWPLVPWTGLNNTVVVGTFLLGVGLFYPAYHLSWLLFERHRKHLLSCAEKINASKMLEHADAVASWRVS